MQYHRISRYIITYIVFKFASLVFLIDHPVFSPATNTAKAIVPTENMESPIILSHRNVCKVGCCINSAERAYHIPCLMLAIVWRIPTGSRLITAIRNTPMFNDQKAMLIYLSFHSCLLVRPFKTNNINPIPSIPYTPKRAVCP